jgi:large subunit ribosomal protein L19
MQAIKEIEQQYRKAQVAQVQSGDTVRVHQLIREGNKKRIQVFEGVVIRTHRPNELTSVITVRRIASGVGVEKTFLLHSPNVQKVEVVRRSKVRRNFLSYLRGRRGKSARLQELAFDKAAVNVSEAKAEAAKTELASSESIDAELTELPIEDESVEVESSTEELAKDENKAAAAEDSPSAVENADMGEENQLAGEEFESGVNKAEDEDDRAQKTT